MTQENVARDLLWPKDSDILVRVVFLYVGQGSSTLVPQIRESIWIDHPLAGQHRFWGSIFGRESEELRSLADGMESF